MSAHGSLVGSLLETMVICLPLTETWLSSMTLQPVSDLKTHHSGLTTAPSYNAKTLYYIQDMLASKAAYLDHRNRSEGQEDLLDVSVKCSKGGVILQQVRCLLDTACKYTKF